MELDFSILKSLRKLKKVTLKKLSDASGVSIQALTKLENNKTNPTVGTLKSICNYFKIDVTSLIQWAEIGHPTKFKSEVIEKLGYSFSTFRINNIINSYVEMKSGAKCEKTVDHSLDYELCHLISGKLKVFINHEPHLLNPGEVIYFDCIYEHTYESLEDSKFIVVVVPKKTEEVLRLKNPFDTTKKK